MYRMDCTPYGLAWLCAVILRKWRGEETEILCVCSTYLHTELDMKRRNLSVDPALGIELLPGLSSIRS